LCVQAQPGLRTEFETSKAIEGDPVSKRKEGRREERRKRGRKGRREGGRKGKREIGREGGRERERGEEDEFLQLAFVGLPTVGTQMLEGILVGQEIQRQ
jgi:hypothetical protein